VTGVLLLITPVTVKPQTLLALAFVTLGPATASAQTQEPSSFTSTVLKTVARDPATYAPALVKYASMRLDWESSQIFFRHGFVERNARYTVSGRSNDVAISHAAGRRKLALDSLVVFAETVPASLAERATERLLIRRYPQHRKVFSVVGRTVRIVGASYLSYSSSMAHVNQWRRNERLARQMGFK
jgi:hypothetical protein